MFSKLFYQFSSKSNLSLDPPKSTNSKLLFFVPALALSLLISDKICQAHRTEG